MKPIRHIIVAIDFTPRCRVALKEAVRQASINRAVLTAVHVMDENLVRKLNRALSVDKPTIVVQWAAHLEKFIAEAEPAAVAVGIDVVVGHPIRCLTEACRRHDCDLLIMGVRGANSQVPRVGAVAAKCVRKVPVDVLLVGEDRAGPFKHVLACVDFSENSARAVRAALQIAEKDGAALDCVHVYQPAPIASLSYGELAMVPPVIDHEILERCKVEFESFLAPLIKDAKVPVDTHVMIRISIREAIQDHVLNSHADLVVLGTRGKGGFRELIIGTTAERIITQAPCSVLAIKPERLIPWSD
jgi:nucleotide-binding universal stress UspA family protein